MTLYTSKTLTDRRSTIEIVRMSQPRENIVFTDPWSTRPAAGINRSLPCLDRECQLKFPDYDARYEHYVALHPYSKPSTYGKKPLKCRLCQKTFKGDPGLKKHIKLKHKRISRDSAATQGDPKASILHQGHRTRRKDEDPQEQYSHVSSRRNSSLGSEVLQYVKRKGSELVGGFIKKVRKASIAAPHSVTPAATEGMEEE